MNDVIEVKECSFEGCPFYKEMTGGPCWDECTHPRGRTFLLKEPEFVDGFPEWCPLKETIVKRKKLKDEEKKELSSLPWLEEEKKGGTSFYD